MGVSLAATVAVAVDVAGSRVAVSVICGVAVSVGGMGDAVFVGGTTPSVSVGAGTGVLVDCFGGF